MSDQFPNVTCPTCLGIDTHPDIGLDLFRVCNICGHAFDLSKESVPRRPWYQMRFFNPEKYVRIVAF